MADYKYSKVHTLKEITENDINYFLKNPISIDIQIIQKIVNDD